MDDLIVSLQSLGVGGVRAVPGHFVSDIMDKFDTEDVDCGDESVACFHINLEHKKFTLTCTGEASLIVRFQ